MRTILVRVTGLFITKDNKNGGVQGEGNAAGLHLVFDESWAGYGKRVIWRNAQGEDPVAMVLKPTTEHLIADQTLEYDTPIPSEALKLPGWCSFTIEGFKEAEPNAVAMTVRDYLRVYQTVSNTPRKERPRPL